MYNGITRRFSVRIGSSLLHLGGGEHHVSDVPSVVIRQKTQLLPKTGPKSVAGPLTSTGAIDSQKKEGHPAKCKQAQWYGNMYLAKQANCKTPLNRQSSWNLRYLRGLSRHRRDAFGCFLKLTAASSLMVRLFAVPVTRFNGGHSC